ncbi:hypothetical protein [Pedobacter gandavensis]|uniref:Beta-carotene 15,15'-monooxygenase n=1 Tax=Pedobacter gandavensis TaxID=2679963 RepID=A0ABR6EWI4_9SPHI|nr:hypothetical protein [Pedobacter gandavensis]MBB2149620.1 hypothetical protein [Pedobacter gandavensis]
MEKQEIYSELHSIRNLMERSAKFISLSGLSGIMAGVYALIGAGIAYLLVYGQSLTMDYRENLLQEAELLWNLFFVALAVLILSIGTGILLTLRKANKNNQKVWNPISKKLLFSMLVPLLTGGLLILILFYRGYYGVIAPTCLIFYGLALVGASNFTFEDVKWLGLMELILGIFAALIPGYGLLFWTIGFGLLHIIYGTIMHFKYDK